MNYHNSSSHISPKYHLSVCLSNYITYHSHTPPLIISTTKLQFAIGKL